MWGSPLDDLYPKADENCPTWPINTAVTYRYRYKWNAAVPTPAPTTPAPTESPTTPSPTTPSPTRPWASYLDIHSQEGPNMYSEAHDCVYLYRPAYVQRSNTWYYDVSSWTSDMKCTFPKGSYMDCTIGSELEGKTNGLFCDQTNDAECQACRDLCDGDADCGGFNLYPYEPFYTNPLRLINDPGVNRSESTTTDLRLCRFLNSLASGQYPQPWFKGTMYWYQEKYDARNYELHIKDGEISMASGKQNVGGSYVYSSYASDSKKDTWKELYDVNHFADHCALADCYNTIKWPDSSFHSGYTKPCDYIDKDYAIPIDQCEAGGDYHDVCNAFLTVFEVTNHEGTRALNRTSIDIAYTTTPSSTDGPQIEPTTTRSPYDDIHLAEYDTTTPSACQTFSLAEDEYVTATATPMIGATATSLSDWEVSQAGNMAGGYIWPVAGDIPVAAALPETDSSNTYQKKKSTYWALTNPSMQK